MFMKIIEQKLDWDIPWHALIDKYQKKLHVNARAGQCVHKLTHLNSTVHGQYARFEPLEADLSAHLCRDNLYGLDHVILKEHTWKPNSTAR
jgi:hypothetical protein